MTSLYDPAKGPAGATGTGAGAGAARGAAAAARRRPPREAKVAAADRVDCSDVLAIAVQHLSGLQWAVDRVDGKWFCDVLHELKAGAYHSPASRSDELRAFLVALRESVERHPRAWRTRELSAAAASIVGFARRGLLPHAQRALFEEPATRAALLALGAAFERRLGDPTAGVVQLTNLLYALARGGLAPTAPVVAKAAAWLAAVEAGDDLAAAVSAAPTGAAVEQDVETLRRRVAAASRCCRRLHTRLPPAAMQPGWAGEGAGVVDLPTASSPLRGSACEPQHLALLLWSFGRALPGSGEPSVASPMPAGSDPTVAAEAVAAASAAVLRRMVAALGDNDACVSPWHVSALAKALAQLSALPHAAAGGWGAGGATAASTWADVSAATGAAGALAARLAEAGLTLPTQGDDANDDGRSGAPALAPALGGADQLSVFQALADEGADGADGGGDVRGASRCTGRRGDGALGDRALAGAELPGLLRTGWAAVASAAVVLQPLLQPQQLATILDGLSSTACGGGAAPSPGGWSSPFPRSAVALVLLQRAVGVLRERGTATSGATRVAFASRFKPGEVAVVLGAAARLRRALAASAAAGHPFQPWLLEDAVPLAHLGPTPTPLRRAAALSEQPPSPPADGWALAGALAAEVGTLLSLAGDAAVANMHEGQLRAPVSAAIVAASAGLAGTADPAANPSAFSAGQQAGGGLPRGQLTALMTHLSRCLAQAGEGGDDEGGSSGGAVGGGDGWADAAEDGDAGDAPGAASAVLSLDARLDAVWAVVAASGPAAASTARGRASPASAARAATAEVLAVLCTRHAVGMSPRQLARLAAACALSAQPPPLPAAGALVHALAAAPEAAGTDPEVAITLAWALPYMLARVGALTPPAGSGSSSGSGSSGDRTALLNAARGVLEGVSAQLEGGDAAATAVGGALAPHADILRATLHRLGAGAARGGPVTAPTRLKAALAAHAEWRVAVGGPAHA